MKKVLYKINIIISAFLITGVSYSIQTTLPGQVDALTIYRGLPIPYWSQTHGTFNFERTDQIPIFAPRWNMFIIIIDILLWFLILNLLWFFIKKIKK